MAYVDSEGLEWGQRSVWSSQFIFSLEHGHVTCEMYQDEE